MRGRYERKTWRHDPTLYAPRRYRRACSYDVFIPDPLPTGERSLDFSISSELATTLSEVEREIITLNQMADPALQSLARLLLRTESIASSRVEGMQADARALAMAEARRSIGRSIGQQAAAIIANIDAMERAVEQAATAPVVQVANLLDIHEVLMRHDPVGRTAGALRNSQNWIGGNDYIPCGAAYVPPPPDDVLALLENLCQFCESDELPPLVQAALAHAQFETIHPFDDGNGRTGRALIQLLLRRRGLAERFVPPISVIFSQSRDSYIRGLVDYREGQLEDWITLFATAAARSMQLAKRFRAEISDLQAFWHERLRTIGAPRRHSVTWQVLDALPAMPVVTVPVAMQMTKRSQPAVNAAISQLEGAGVLTRIGTSQRYRTWEPQGLLDLIIDLESGHMPISSLS